MTVVIIIVLLILFGFFLYRRVNVDDESMEITFDVDDYEEELVQEIREKIESEGDIPAIKLVREKLDFDLVEAKKLVDAVKEQM